MNMLLHYLKFDFRRWRGLLFGLWGLLAVFVVVSWMFLDPDPGTWRREWYQRIAQTAWLLQWVALLCAVAVCLSAAGADSPVASGTWLLTRPRRARQLIVSRLLLVLAGVVLPGAICYALSLAVLGFDAVTVWSALGNGTLTVGVAAAVLMLWALMNPCVPALLLGALAAGIVWLGAWFVMPEGLPPGWLRYYPPPVCAFLLLAIPALLGLRGLWRRQSRRHWAWTGFHMGIMVLAFCAFMPAAEHVRRKLASGEAERLVFPKKFADWELPLARPGPGAPRALRAEEATWHIAVQKPAPPEEVMLYSMDVQAIAWRNGPDAAWSDWVEGRGQAFMAGTDGEWLISFSCDPRRMRDLNNGELRLRTQLALGRRELRRVPLKDGAVQRGEGWTWELLNLKRREGASFSYMAAERFSLYGSRPVLRAEPEQGPGAATYGEVAGYRFFNSTPAAFYRRMRHVWTPRGDQTPPQPPPEFLRLQISWPQEIVEKTVHLTGINLSAPVQEKAPDAPLPTPPPEEEDFPPSLSVSGWMRSSSFGPPPWTEGTPPDISSEPVRLAMYLTRLVRDNRGATPVGWSRDAPLAALVPQHLELFLETVARYQGGTGIILAALVAGAPEERRGEILRRIPKTPDFALVAEARGWREEARPYLLEMARTGNTLPDELLPLCRSYRDPAFHPYMRRRFTADVPTVRYWESMPDLAPDLPAELEKIRAALRRTKGSSADRYQAKAPALLYTGDFEALAWLLEEREYPWSLEVIRRRLRDAAGEPLSDDDEKLQAWLAGVSARDFTFHPGRRCFIRKPSPAP